MTTYLVYGLPADELTDEQTQKVLPNLKIYFYWDRDLPYNKIIGLEITKIDNNQTVIGPFEFDHNDAAPTVDYTLRENNIEKYPSLFLINVKEQNLYTY